VVAQLVGLGQRAAGGRVPYAKVIAARADGPQAGHGLTQARSAGKLREDHAEQLIHDREGQRASANAMTCNGPFKSASGKKIQKLSKDGATLIHPPMISGRPRQTDSKSAMADEIVYPNENADRLENPDPPSPN
jgi:hypothetical protein